MNKIIEVYKIKQVYPTLDKKFKVGDYLQKIKGNNVFTLDKYGIITSSFESTIDTDEVENHPDFFEKINLQITFKEI